MCVSSDEEKLHKQYLPTALRLPGMVLKDLTSSAHSCTEGNEGVCMSPGEGTERATTMMKEQMNIFFTGFWKKKNEWPGTCAKWIMSGTKNYSETISLLK